MGFVSVSVMTRHKETRDSLACTTVFFLQEKPLILPFTWYLGSGWGQFLPTAERAFWREGRRWIPAPFLDPRLTFFFFLEKKSPFIPKLTLLASSQEYTFFSCRLLNMLPLRSYIKPYFLSVGDKLKPGKLPCNFSYLDSPVGKRRLQLSGYSWELLHRGRKGVKSRLAAPREDGGGSGVPEDAGLPFPVQR